MSAQAQIVEQEPVHDWCEPCWDRHTRYRQATHVADGLRMCDQCFWDDDPYQPSDDWVVPIQVSEVKAKFPVTLERDPVIYKPHAWFRMPKPKKPREPKEEKAI